jgi:hypothetical protein
MPKRSSTTKQRKRDGAKIVSSIADLVPGNPLTADRLPEKNPAAVALGRLGGLKGGKARAEKLSPKRRKQIAKLAAEARWAARSE